MGQTDISSIFHTGDRVLRMQWFGSERLHGLDVLGLGSWSYYLYRPVENGTSHVDYGPYARGERKERPGPYRPRAHERNPENRQG